MLTLNRAEIIGNKPLVVTILGGGSNFVPGFAGTMCNYPGVFTNAQVRLYDTDMSRVVLIKTFCRKYSEFKKIPMTFTEVPELDASLEGADFVITNFRIGGINAIALDETIPPRFGYWGEETAGPGGMFMSMRTVPVVVDVAKRMEKLCPDGWLINYANPTNHITDAVFRTSSTKCVGLCDGFIEPSHCIAASLGIEDYKSISVRHAGINHCAWTYRAEIGNRDLLKELEDLTEEQLENNITKVPQIATWSLARYKRWHNLFKITGLYPTPSVHMAAAFHFDEELAEQLEAERIDERTNEVILQEHIDNRLNRAVEYRKRLSAVLEDFQEAEAEDLAGARADFADLAFGVIAALAGDTVALYPTNVLNGGGIVPGLPADAVVENYCVVTRHGFAPLGVPHFPKYIQAQQAYFLAYQQTVVQGILEKDLRMLRQAMCMHPNTTSVDKAMRVFDALWEEGRELLGKYWS